MADTLPALCRDRISKQELAARLNRYKTFWIPTSTCLRFLQFADFRNQVWEAQLPARSDPENRRINVFGIDLAVSIMDGPELSEHRRKELAFARLMAETIDLILYTGESDVDIRIDAAKDMIREFRDVYEETKEP